MGVAKKSRAVEAVDSVNKRVAGASKTRHPLSISPEEWENLKVTHPSEVNEFAAALGAFVVVNAVASRNAEALSKMLDGDMHGLSSIEEFIKRNPLDALTAVRLLRLEREKKERARTSKARKANEKMSRTGKTKAAQAEKKLKQLEASGGDIMARDVSNNLAKAIGCDARTVTGARSALLKKRK